MSWERMLLELFDDLEARAEGAVQEVREDEVTDLARMEYAEVSLVDRLHGAVGELVTLAAAGGVRIEGRVEGVGSGCAALVPVSGPGTMHLVNLDHVHFVATSSQQARAEPLLASTSRLGLASAVRHLAEEVDAVSLTLTDGRRIAGDLARVGSDFVEIAPAEAEGGRTTLVALRSIVVLVAG